MCQLPPEWQSRWAGGRQSAEESDPEPWSHGTRFVVVGCEYRSHYNEGMYSEQVLDHFEHPRNPGEVANPDASVQIENPACGDILKLSLRIQQGRIAEIRFRAKGCVPAMACASLITELVKGRTPVEARRVRREELVRAIGGLPEASAHASYLAMDALLAVLKQLPG